MSRELRPSYDLEVYVNGETVVAERVTDGAPNVCRDRKGSAVGETNHVRIVKRGKGTLYLSSSIEYYTNDENVAARGSGGLECHARIPAAQGRDDGLQLEMVHRAADW